MISTCPVCDEYLDSELNLYFSYNDYPSNFDFDCRKCGAKLSVEVVPIPEFDVTEREEE